MFSLSTLTEYDGILIQCHDIPDADTIASAFAAHIYLKDKGVTSRIIYSGTTEITKPNLLKMITELNIPIEYIKQPYKTDALLLIDCQHGERNVTAFPADTVFVIDHHMEYKPCEKPGIIRSQLAACATLMWDLMRDEGFDFDKYPDVSTALYYGLFTDTNNLEEIAHPLDKDARDSLKFNANIIKNLRNNNLTLAELCIAGEAFTNYHIETGINYATFRAAPCDPNILGFTSDLALQVSGIDVCVVYNETPGGYKLSVRSCARAVMASEFVWFITNGIGSGGGHISKAGGFISKDKLDELISSADTESFEFEKFIANRAAMYFNSFDVIDAASHNLPLEKMKRYIKKKIPVGYVKTTDIFPERTQIIIRTLEGDAEAAVSDDTYLMVGIVGEVYPITRDKFNKTYDNTTVPLAIETEYPPTVRNKQTGETAQIMQYIRPCIAKGESYIIAMPVTRNTKVFTKWNTEGYYSGVPGDYIAARADDPNDIYLIRADVFARTYEEA